MNLTLEKLAEQMAELKKLPPVPFLASSAYLPSDSAIQFKEGDRLYVGAGPAFWAKVPPSPNSAGTFGAVTIWDLDAEGNKGNRADFFGALARVLSAGHCKEGDRCVCGGDTPEIQACCSNWVR